MPAYFLQLLHLRRAILSAVPVLKTLSCGILSILLSNYGRGLEVYNSAGGALYGILVSCRRLFYLHFPFYNFGLLEYSTLFEQIKKRSIMAPDLNSLPPSPHLGSAPETNGAGGPAPFGAAQPKMPNILYIMADQLAAPLLKMYKADSQIKTPNLDALASKAVVFESAYTPSPLCAPSRMSMITGLLPMKIGAYDNAAQISSDIPTYAHYLRLRGYHTVLAGKMHFVGDQLHGYETRLTSDIYPGDFGWVVNWEEPDTRLEWYHNASSILQAGTCVRSNQLDYDEEVMYKSTQYLYDHVRRGDDRPFCLTVCRQTQTSKTR